MGPLRDPALGLTLSFHCSTMTEYKSFQWAVSSKMTEVKAVFGTQLQNIYIKLNIYNYKEKNRMFIQGRKLDNSTFAVNTPVHSTMYKEGTLTDLDLSQIKRRPQEMHMERSPE